MKVTPETHPDYASLERTFQRLSEFVAVVNENSREANNMKALREIESNLTGAEVFSSSLFFPSSSLLPSPLNRKEKRD